MKYMTYTSAVETLKKFFRGNSSNIVSLDDVFVAWGRDLNDAEKNKSWVGNKLTHLKHYNLITPVYSYGKRRELTSIQLTEEGKKVLGRIEGVPSLSGSANSSVSPETVLRDVKKLQEQLPNFNIVFRIEPKEVEITK